MKPEDRRALALAILRNNGAPTGAAVRIIPALERAGLLAADAPPVEPARELTAVRELAGELAASKSPAIRGVAKRLALALEGSTNA